MKKVLNLIFIVGLLWLIIVTFNNYKNRSNDKEPLSISKIEELPEVNFKAPSFSLNGLDEKNYSLESAKGKPIIVNFWASWCGPCKVEAPELVNLYEENKEELEIYAVNMTGGDSLEGAKGFVEEYGFEFPILLDEENQVADKYKVTAIPTTFFINKEGIIVEKIVGYGGPKALIEKTQKLLSQ